MHQQPRQALEAQAWNTLNAKQYITKQHVGDVEEQGDRASILAYLAELAAYGGARAAAMMDRADEWCGEALGSPVQRCGEEEEEEQIDLPAESPCRGRKRRRGDDENRVQGKIRSARGRRTAVPDATEFVASKRNLKHPDGLGKIDGQLMEHLRGCERRWGRSRDAQACSSTAVSSQFPASSSTPPDEADIVPAVWTPVKGWTRLASLPSDLESLVEGEQPPPSPGSGVQSSCASQWRLATLAKSIWQWLRSWNGEKAEDAKANAIIDSLDDSFKPTLSYFALAEDIDDDEDESDEEGVELYQTRSTEEVGRCSRVLGYRPRRAWSS